jgi:hypothetical protein
MRYFYRPDHPQADKFGMVEASETVDYSGSWVTSVISDTMQPLKHHGTGRVIDSKAKFRAETRAIGAVEIGNEPIRSRAPVRLDKRQRREDIRKAVYDLRNGHRPPPVVFND